VAYLAKIKALRHTSAKARFFVKEGLLGRLSRAEGLEEANLSRQSGCAAKKKHYACRYNAVEGEMKRSKEKKWENAIIA